MLRSSRFTRALTKKDVATISSLIGGLEAKIEAKMNAKMDSFENSFEAKMNAKLDSFENSFEAKMNAKLDSFESKMNAKMDSLASKMDSMAAFLPGFSASRVQQFVVTDEGEDIASVLDGADATYTYVRHGNRYFALGAARCALYFPPPLVSSRDALRFVCLPLSVAANAKRILTARHISAKQRDTDYIAIELNKNPLASEPPQWPVPFLPSSHRGRSVYGWSNSGHVGGYALVNDPVNRTLSFIWERGDPGQSGALLYSAGTHEPLGVFFGVRGTRANLTPRGQIVPLPAPDTLTSHEIVRLPSARYLYCAHQGCYHVKRIDGNACTIRDGPRSFAGVFVKHTTGLELHGALICGASRPKCLASSIESSSIGRGKKT